MRAKTAVVLGAQWGDEGKGKIVDVLSGRFDAVARYAGGHNAGHTVIIEGQKFVLQLIPCGVLRPGCKGVIGNGVVLDTIAFLKEVKKLRELGVAVDEQLYVSNRAQVILPYHRMIELAAESAPGRQKIGTTSRGIGPAYEDKMKRSGLRVVDLLSSGGAGTGEGGRPAADDAAWIADCRGELAAARAALLGHEALIGVLDLVCGGGQRPREISTDQRESEQLETALRLGLDMLGRHRAARRALARII